MVVVVVDDFLDDVGSVVVVVVLPMFVMLRGNLRVYINSGSSGSSSSSMMFSEVAAAPGAMPYIASNIFHAALCTDGFFGRLLSLSLSLSLPPLSLSLSALLYNNLINCTTVKQFYGWVTAYPRMYRISAVYLYQY